MNKILRNIIKVALSNVATVISGVIVGFVLPKIIGVTNYGYYKTFSLYIAYVSIFQFGLCEGVYLKYGGCDFEQLDKGKFRHFTRVLSLSQCLITIFGIIISLFFLSGEFRFIFVCVALFVLFQNLTTYYQYISQITGRFNELSIRNLLKSILSIISVISMWIYYHFNPEFLSYKVYTLCYVGIFGALCIWYIFTYRDITFGKAEKDREKNECWSLIKIGFPLLISNLCATLIFTIDRQFVSVLFDIAEYGSYAFAYNMLSLVTVATSSIATVLYPVLKRSNEEMLKKIYPGLVFIFNFFVFLCISIYFPLNKFVNVFFETQAKYIDSLPIFRVILPSLAVSCTITVIIHNYFKTFQHNVSYFVIVIIVLVFSFILNLLAYVIFKTTVAISIASVIITVIWYLIASVFLKYKYGLKLIKNTIYILLCLTIFYLVSILETWWLGFIIYLGIVILLSFAMYWKNIIYLIRNKKIMEE